MNLPSEASSPATGTQRSLPSRTFGDGMPSALASLEKQAVATIFEPLEFRSLAESEVETILGAASETQEGLIGRRDGDDVVLNAARRVDGRGMSAGLEVLGRDAAARDAIDAARREGIQAGEHEGRRAARAQLEAQMQESIARERRQLLAAVEEFAGARDMYFSDVEQEVVKLALAIAARVLHREAQMDPLLLAAAVRVALEKMADRSGVVLRASIADVGAWERMFQATEPADRPRVMADERLEQGECVLETKLGTVELGVRAQLEEIERGFFDLLNHRPVQVNQRSAR